MKKNLVYYTLCSSNNIIADSSFLETIASRKNGVQQCVNARVRMIKAKIFGSLFSCFCFKEELFFPGKGLVSSS